MVAAMGGRSRGPGYSRERKLAAEGWSHICGIDEAGRGPLAGPVVAAAVVLDPKCIPRGLDDSKKLDAAERERLFVAISGCAAIGVGVADVARIDRDNILEASL